MNKLSIAVCEVCVFLLLTGCAYHADVRKETDAAVVAVGVNFSALYDEFQGEALIRATEWERGQNLEAAIIGSRKQLAEAEQLLRRADFDHSWMENRVRVLAGRISQENSKKQPFELWLSRKVIQGQLHSKESWSIAYAFLSAYVTEGKTPEATPNGD